MKNKFGVILLCAAIVMSLCACKPLNIHSDGNGNGNGNNGGNNSASGAISVGFVVEEAGAAPEGVISISAPIPDDILNGDVVFQYKAIPGSTSSETIGATGDEWKALPSVFTGLGEEFKMDFSAGEWTFDLQGVDKEDSTPKYKLSEQVKANITSNFKDNIIFRVKLEEGTLGDGEGTIDIDIMAQSIGGYDDYDDGQLRRAVRQQDFAQSGILIVQYRLGGDEKWQEKSFDYDPDSKEDDIWKTYFKDSFKLPSGIYEMKFTYHYGRYKTTMGPYDVIVAADKTTSVTGIMAHESQYMTFFSTSDKKFEYVADFFNGTAEEHTAGWHMNQDEKKLARAATVRAEDNDDQDVGFQPDKSMKYIVFGLVTISNNNNDNPTAESKKIGTRHILICNGKEYALGEAPTSYKVGQDFENDYSITRYAIPETAFDEPEQVIKIKVIWSNNGTELVAESEEVTILFIDGESETAVDAGEPAVPDVK